MVPAGEQVPSAWTAELVDPLVHRVGFTTVKAATKWLDTREFSIVPESENGWSCGTAHFFDVYQQLDAQTAPANAEPLPLVHRHHAAAYAAATAAAGIGAIETDRQSTRPNSSI